MVSGDLGQYLCLDPSPRAVEEVDDVAAEFLLEALVAGEVGEDLPGLVIEGQTGQTQRTENGVKSGRASR